MSSHTRHAGVYWHWYTPVYWPAMRRQVGRIDAELLTRVDAEAAERGQTRRVFIERALERELELAKERADEGSPQQP